MSRRARGRVWRVGKWAGVALCAGIVLAWILSLGVSARIKIVRGAEISLLPGEVRYLGPYRGPAGFVAEVIMDSSRGPVPSAVTTLGCVQVWRTRVSSLRDIVGQRGPQFESASVTVTAYTQSTGIRTIRQMYAALPLWILFLCAAILTGILWYRDGRRIPVGHCQRCGYDLTKNESGRCPECGAHVEPSEGTKKPVETG